MATVFFAVTFSLRFFFSSVVFCSLHFDFFCAVVFFGGVERAHLVSSILHGLFVSFGSCFAGLCADAQLGSRCCFALAA